MSGNLISFNLNSVIPVYNSILLISNMRNKFAFSEISAVQFIWRYTTGNYCYEDATDI